MIVRVAEGNCERENSAIRSSKRERRTAESGTEVTSVTLGPVTIFPRRRGKAAIKFIFKLMFKPIFIDNPRIFRKWQLFESKFISCTNFLHVAISFRFWSFQKFMGGEMPGVPPHPGARAHTYFVHIKANGVRLKRQIWKNVINAKE